LEHAPTPKRTEEPVRTPAASETPELMADQVAELKRVFPETVTEEKVDFDKLMFLSTLLTFPRSRL
jgi:hypothetical protein